MIQGDLGMRAAHTIHSLFDNLKIIARWLPLNAALDYFHARPRTRGLRVVFPAVRGRLTSSRRQDGRGCLTPGHASRETREGQHETRHEG